MTSVHPWNPNTVHLAGVNSQIGEVSRECAEELADGLIGSDNHLMESIQPSLCLPELKKRIMSTVNVKSRGVKRRIQQVDVPARRTMVSTERHTKLKASEIAELWGIGPRRAEDTIKATTQRGTRSAIMPISRRYRADRMFQVKRLNGKFATDTLFADEKSLLQNACGQVYTHKCDFSAFYPLISESGENLGNSLLEFIMSMGHLLD